MYNPDIFTALHNLDVALCSKINALDKRIEGLESFPAQDGIYDLPLEISKLISRRIIHAMETCRGNKTDAAKMLGISNYQTLTNWINKYGVEI
jgi:DNA-binding protein Fis